MLIFTRGKRSGQGHEAKARKSPSGAGKAPRTAELTNENNVYIANAEDNNLFKKKKKKKRVIGKLRFGVFEPRAQAFFSSSPLSLLLAARTIM